MDMSNSFRLGMRRLASGVSIVTTRENDVRYAMTASSVTSLSDNPASLLLCVNEQASIQPILIRGKAFAVNVLGIEHQELSNICAQREASNDRFNTGDWGECEDNGLPYLKDAQATFFCQVDNDMTKYGTHQIVVGRITDILIAESPINPLIYVDGAYQKITV